MMFRQCRDLDQDFEGNPISQFFGIPSNFNKYTLGGLCTKFCALIQSVTIQLLRDLRYYNYFLFIAS